VAIEEVLFTRLTTHAGLTALIGKRCYPLVMPQSTRETEGAKLPCVVYQRITGRHEYTHDGEANLAHPRYQFSCYAKTYQDARDVRLQVQAALSAWSDMGLSPGVFVGFIDMEMDLYDSEVEMFRCVIDATIWHEET
jgi:hypothetical protein